jgi:hypothetical protein
MVEVKKRAETSPRWLRGEPVVYLALFDDAQLDLAAMD